MSGVLTAAATLLPVLGNILEKIIPDPNKAAEIKAQLVTEMYRSDGEFYKAAGSIISAEAKGESWMQRNWRPITMLTFVFIIANNYVLVPWMNYLFATTIPTLEIPGGMWGLLQIGIGGYITSRGVEKSIQSIQNGGVPLIGSKQQPDAVTQKDLDLNREELLRELRNVT